MERLQALNLICVNILEVFPFIILHITETGKSFCKGSRVFFPVIR